MKHALLLFACLFVGCGLPALESHADKAITEIGESFHTGLHRGSLEITLSRDGTADLTCTFYGVGKHPAADSIQVRSITACEDQFKKNPAGFVERDLGELTGTFKGEIELEQFDRLAKLMVDNGFLTMADKYEEPGLMDAPPTFTWIIYPKGKKQVSDQNNKGGPKLKEVEDAIYKATKEIAFK